MPCFGLSANYQSRGVGVGVVLSSDKARGLCEQSCAWPWRSCASESQRSKKCCSAPCKDQARAQRPTRPLSPQFSTDQYIQAGIMSTGKRPASGSFGSSQMVVKRPNLGNDKAVAVVNGSAANGALIQAVCKGLGMRWGNALNFMREQKADCGGIGTADKWFAGPSDGADRAFGRSFHGQI